MTIKIIDTHAHVVLGKAFGKAGKYGPETGIDENGLPFFRIGAVSYTHLTLPTKA